jgi:outer membrane receptor protein involved in Fe transport
MKDQMSHKLLAVGAICLSFTLIDRAQAQSAGTVQTNSSTNDTSGALEEVIVTAEHRSEDLQRTAISVTALSGEELQSEGRYSAAQILEDVPGVTVYINGQNGGETDSQTVVPSDSPASAIVIRGLASVDPPGLGSSTTSVAYYADGIYNGIGGDFDLNRAEVLRGPQGTEYGRSATSGVVAVHTNDPTLGAFSGAALGEVASYDLHHVEGAVNLPIGDTLAVRVSVNQFDEHGIFASIGSEQKEQEARVKVLYQPNSDFSLLVGYVDRADYDNSGGAIEQNIPNIPGSIEVISGFPIFPNVTDMHQLWAQLNWNIGLGSLTYIPAYHTYDTRGSVVAFNGHIQQQQSVPLDRYLTHELRLASHDDSRIKWAVGGTYFDNSQQTIFNPIWRVSRALVSDSVTTTNTQDVGAFAEATLPIASTWSLTAGLRYDSTRIQESETVTQNFAAGNTAPNFDSPTDGLPENLGYGSIGGPAGRLSYDNLTYKIRLEDEVTPRNLVYAMVSTGFLPGSENLITVKQGTTETIVVNELTQEKLTSFEVGSKNRFLDDHLQVNADAFFYDYQGFQETANVNPTIPGDFATISSPAQVFGLELEADYRLSVNDRVKFNVGYTDGYFVNETAEFQSILAQSHIPLMVPLSSALSYDHTFRLPGGSTLDIYDQLRFTSGYDESTLTAAELPAEPYVHIGNQFLDDFDLRWRSANTKYGATFYVHNVSNEKYMQDSNIASYHAATMTTPEQVTVGAITIVPRVFGVIVDARF